MDELHHKTAKWLCSNFRVVLSCLRHSKWSRGEQTASNGSKTARATCSWSHHRFRMCLHAKARESPWCKVIDTTEEFTTKTCGGCGHIDKTIGSKKEYKCNICGFEADRDHNGARNVLITFFGQLNRQKNQAAHYVLSGVGIPAGVSCNAIDICCMTGLLLGGW